MKHLVILLLMLIPAFLVGVGITYTMANGMFTSSLGQTYFEFDVMVQATETGTRLGDGIVFLEYSTEAFGETVDFFGNITVTKGLLLQDLTLPPPFPPMVMYDLYKNDSLTDVVSFTFEYMQSTGYGSLLTTDPQQLTHVKIEVIDTDVQAWVCFWPDVMSGETYYDDHNTIYDPIDVGNCLYQDPPLPVELSYFSCVMSNTNAAVNLTWVTQTETNMVGFRVIRGESNVLEEAADQGVLVAATNTSNENVYYWSDTEILSDHTYNYWLEAQDMDGTSQFYGPTSITTPSQNINAPNIPLVTGLTSVYPNPFNPDLTIHYTVERSCPVQIYITNIRGQIVKELVNAAKDRGTYKFIWDGTDSSGRPCSSGVFYIKMLAGGKEYNKKAVLLK